MTEAELNKQYYLKTIQTVSSVYVNTMSPKRELEILGDICIVKSWNSVSKTQQDHFENYLVKNAKALGMQLERLMR